MQLFLLIAGLAAAVKAAPSRRWENGTSSEVSYLMAN